MSVLPLMPASDPALRIPADPVPRVDDAIRDLIRDLIDTMYEYEGIGIAAPQVGRSLQVIVANPSLVRGHERVLVNPVVEALQGRAARVEGCLSVPEVWERVGRAAWMRVQGLNEQGRVVSLEAEGLLAAVIQHECDHLQGRLFLDHVPWVRRWLVRPRPAPGVEGRGGPRQVAGPGPVRAGAGACA
jgi:peptide deformylase